MSRTKKALLWVATILLALLFLMAGTNKLARNPAMMEQFAGWGYPVWFMLLIGLIEVLGAVALLIPRLARLGATPLVAVMLGAAATHLRASEWPNVGFTLLLAAGLLWIARSRTPRRPT